MSVRKPRVAGVVALVVLGGACSGNSDHTALDMSGQDPMGDRELVVPEGKPFNAIDVAFAQGMIVHHGQAIEMADIALGAAERDDVRGLAAQIKAAQDPEIETMRGWLDEWNFDAPDPSGGMSQDMHSSSGMSMSGMMTDDEMSDFRKLLGARSDRRFLEMMIRHHEGAIEMSEQAVTGGEEPRVIELAQAIISAQQAEIDEMRSILTDMT